MRVWVPLGILVLKTGVIIPGFVVDHEKENNRDEEWIGSEDPNITASPSQLFCRSSSVTKFANCLDFARTTNLTNWNGLLSHQAQQVE